VPKSAGKKIEIKRKRGCLNTYILFCAVVESKTPKSAKRKELKIKGKGDA